jgi:hypothetical protein
MTRALLMGILLLGCDQWAMPPITTELGVTKVTSAPLPPVVSNERALRDIAEARCTKQLSCEPTSNECPADTQTATRDYLLGAECSDGVSVARLSRCLNDLAGQACDAARSPQLIATCHNDQLCR